MPALSQEKYLKLIGKAVVRFNELDLFLSFCISEILGFTRERSKFGQRITIYIPYGRKLELLSSLILEIRGKDFWKQFKSLYKRLKSCGESRNDYMHSSWYLGDQEIMKEKARKLNLRHAFKGRLPYKYDAADHLVATEELSEFVEECFSLQIELLHLLADTDRLK